MQDKNLKRRFSDVEPLKNEDNQIKQPRPSSAEASHGSRPQSIRQSQEQRIAAVSDSRYVYNGYTLNDKPFSSEASHGTLPYSIKQILELVENFLFSPTVLCY